MSDPRSSPRFPAPLRWLIAALAGMLLGGAVGLLLPARPASVGHGHGHGHAPASPGHLAVAPSDQSVGADDEAGDLTVTETRRDGTVHVLRGVGANAAAAAAEQARLHGADNAHHHPAPHIPWFAVLPFALLLGAVALMPFINAHWWHEHYPEVSLALGGFVSAYYLLTLGPYGRETMLHVGLEYYAFLALVGGLYVAAGGLLVDLRLRATPLNNTLILALGAVLANLIGTTGASVVLIRPFMRINSPQHAGGNPPHGPGRLHPLQLVFFIFIVSNCGGCLTPIGDPPLYLGYLKGVPFMWTLEHMWPMWLLVNGVLLTAFFGVDTWLARRSPPAELTPADAAHGPLRVMGWSSIVCLTLIVAGVFIDPLLKTVMGGWGPSLLPVGATFQVLVAIGAYFWASPRIHRLNEFSFGPVKEVGLLFAGIFATMAPALAFLDQHAPALGLENPTQFYFATGGLSAVLDNAPTYLSFLQIAFSVLGLQVNPADIARFIDSTYAVSHPALGGAAGRAYSFSGQAMLEGISLGAVFFGAMTYIGNGPNFMVKAIAEARGVKMPSFFGYVGWAAVFLAPVLVVNWWVFVR